MYPKSEIQKFSVNNGLRYYTFGTKVLQMSVNAEWDCYQNLRVFIISQNWNIIFGQMSVNVEFRY